MTYILFGDKIILRSRINVLKVWSHSSDDRILLEKGDDILNPYFCLRYHQILTNIRPISC